MENRNWKEIKLSSICDIISSKTSIQNATLENYISTENMINDFGGVQNAEKLPTTNTVNAFEKNDILFSNIRTYFKKVWHAKFAGTVSQDVLTFRAKENVISKFLYYTLCNPDFTEYTVLTSKGAKMPRGDKDAIRNFDIQLPPLPEQKAIASVLSSLDDKIDLLHQQNQTLEALAETLFRQWLIEEAKEDWEEGKLEDLVLSANTGLDAIRRAPIVENYTGIKCLRIQDISQNKTFDNWGNTEVKDSDFVKAQLKRGDIIMARTCSPGILLHVQEDLNAVFNNGLARIRANENSHPIFLKYLFKTNEFINHIYGISDGTAVQLNMKLGDLLSYDLKIPPINCIEKFVEIVSEWDDKILSNQQQIQTLTQLRDTLLPKLMSGEVRVKV